MSRSVLLQWSAHEFAPGVHPERNDRTSNRVDRVIGAAIGRVLRLASPLRVRQLRRFAAEVDRAGRGLETLTEEQLRARGQAFHSRVAGAGLSRALAAEIFAVIREASGRVLRLRHYPTQIMAGYTMLRGGVAELQTGEGKTLSATLPAIAVALARIPVHVVTVNEYLAQRDAKHLGPLYEFFGLTVGYLVPDDTPEARRQAYARDVTYCVNKDLVFDYLRDQLDTGRVAASRVAVRRLFSERPETAKGNLRGLYFAIIDEADSVLIDEARTPLVISATAEGSVGLDDYRHAMAIAQTLGEDHVLVSPSEHLVRLTSSGQARVEQAVAQLGGLWRFRKARDELIEQALAALKLYERDRHYILADGKVQIVDEFTGRTMADRSWERGLHQLIELKEAVELTEQRETIARLTYQRFFRRYLHLAGMSGTVAEVAPELRAVFGLDFVAVPSHRPIRRLDYGDRVYLTSAARWNAVVSRIIEMRAAGRAILVGTRSVEASEHLSALLIEQDVEHTLLNARQDADEATIVSQAGQPGRVTVATNMAGRGTDIALHPAVRDAGGLHVILTELHESRRIDRQLHGRAGRQGDPGSCETIVSLEDDLFTKFGGPIARYAARRYAGAEMLPRHIGWLLRWWAQHGTERLHARIRRRTLEADKQLGRSLAFSGRAE